MNKEVKLTAWYDYAKPTTNTTVKSFKEQFITTWLNVIYDFASDDKKLFIQVCKFLDSFLLGLKNHGRLFVWGTMYHDHRLFVCSSKFIKGFCLIRHKHHIALSTVSFGA